MIGCFRFLNKLLHHVRPLHFKLLALILGQDLLFRNEICYIVGFVAHLLPLPHNVVIELRWYVFLIFVWKLINIVTVVRSQPMCKSVISHHHLQAKVFQGSTFTSVAVTKGYRVNFIGIVQRFNLFYFAETVLLTLFLWRS